MAARAQLALAVENRGFGGVQADEGGGLAECTVKTQLQDVFAKINVNNRVTLTLYATRRHL